MSFHLTGIKKERSQDEHSRINLYVEGRFGPSSFLSPKPGALFLMESGCLFRSGFWSVLADFGFELFMRTTILCWFLLFWHKAER
jgi:hypothetical protein